MEPMDQQTLQKVIWEKIFADNASVEDAIGRLAEVIQQHHDAGERILKPDSSCISVLKEIAARKIDANTRTAIEIVVMAHVSRFNNPDESFKETWGFINRLYNKSPSSYADTTWYRG